MTFFWEAPLGAVSGGGAECRGNYQKTNKNWGSIVSIEQQQPEQKLKMKLFSDELPQTKL